MTEAGAPGTVADAAARREALDPRRSFIVQAPAGSGKTELLTQRYLTLLACVNEPEEVVAITFTRKAAAEMRHRIVTALAHADKNASTSTSTSANDGDDAVPLSAHARLTRDLARAVLARDAERDWALSAHPTRLRILTIDALCGSLSRQMPLLSRLGSQPGIDTEPGELYREAARATLAELETRADWSPAVEQLLRHLDNRLDQAESMLAEMLMRRDQWLRHVSGRGDERLQRATLEAALARITQAQIAALAEAVPATLGSELVALATYAANSLRAAQREAEGDTAADAAPVKDTGILACAQMTALPDRTLAALPQWQGLAALLLTKGDKKDWRRRVDKNIGFPAPGQTRDKDEKQLRQTMKARMETLLGELGEAPGLLDALVEITRAVPPAYSDAQWMLLEALFELLPLAVAQLNLIFAARGQIDFTEMAQAALRALGEAEQPTDLALALDYRISHLLVDEFQDTSMTQFALLERLTAGWVEGDGRTLFVVGDPMQSIYRFREAEVGLYLQARHAGVGQVRLHPLRLSVNFRSTRGIVEWVNAAFAQVMPEHDDVASGAVAYAPSQAFHPLAASPAVTVHTWVGRQDDAEAEQVAALAATVLRQDTHAQVAVLVRGRTHLQAILPALRRAGLRYQAVEIEPLAQRPVVQDLLALTRALLHPADRIAWLSVLRAPWCGLSLHDLHALCADNAARTIPALLGEAARRARLSEQGQRQLARVWPVLQAAQAQRRRGRLRRRVEGTWLALGGPACCTDSTDLADADACLDLLDELEEGADLVDLGQLETRMAKLYARADINADERLQVMTIHKAKGLEFDTVIVPGLGRRPRSATPTLLQWSERPLEQAADGHEVSDLLLAPIRRRGETEDPVYTYLQRQEACKQRHEDGRLLYVAATRACRQLHIMGHVEVAQADGETQLRDPVETSLLRRLWPVVEGDFHAAVRKHSTRTRPDGEDDVPDRPQGSAPLDSDFPLLRRLPIDWVRPEPERGLDMPAVQALANAPAGHIEFEWAGETARHVGTVVHRYLQHIGQDGLAHWQTVDLAALRPAFRAALLGLGVPLDVCGEGAERVQAALHNSLSDERGRWILAPHTEARCEYALTGVWRERIVSVVIDRSFVDAQGQRWIIDYKTSVHEGSDTEAFLDQEVQRYRGQLETYAGLMQGMDTRPIRLGLYFPLLNAWREWSAPDDSDAAG